MNDADDLFGAILVNGNARVFMLSHNAEDGIEIGIDGERDDVVAGRHDLARGVIGKLDEPLNGVLLELLKVAFVAAGLNDVLQLFGRVAAAFMATAAAEQTQYERRMSAR